MAEALQHAIDSIEEASKSKEMGKPSPVFDTAPPDVATQRFTRAKASSAGSILGISAELLNELRDTLLDCGPFDTAHELNALFVNARLIPWRNRLPEANNPLERVEITIDFLNAQSNEEGENALILFLKVLIDRMNRQDQCWHKLNALVRALETDETAPQPNGDSEFDVNEVSITVYHEPGVFESPDQLFGREALIAELRPMLEKYQNLLFQGLGGSGKTALAATIADYLLDESNHPVIWIHVGHEDYDTVVDALVDELVEDQEERQEIRSAEGRNKSIMLRNMLRRSNSHLLVLDDVWVADVLQLLRIVPRNMGVIVTSRFRFPRLHIIDVVDLLPNDAVKLLIHYSGIQDLDQDPHALQLCKTLGYHAYALEIAGNILRVDDLTPEQLTAVIKDAPHHITMPDGGIEEGRESVAALLESSFELLSKREKSLFLTFGHLFAPGATFQLIYTFVALDEKDAQQSLNSLVRRGLIKRRYYKEEAIEFFTIHDLTFYFARGKAKQGEGMTIEERNSAVLQYLKVNVQEQMYNHLEVNLANILGAARNASKSSKEDFVRIMSWLCVGGYPRPEVFGYLEERGSTLPMLRLLDESSQAAKELELTEPLHYLWAKQGNIAIDRQEFSRAAEFYSKAAKISPNRERKVKLTSLVGKALSFYGDDERAEYFFKNAEDLADSNTLKEFVYGQQAHAAGQREDFIAAENFAFKQEMINRDILAQLGEDPTNHLEKEGALRGLFRALVNKGTARLRSGIGSPNEIIEIHNEARDIAIELENEEMLAHAHWALAEDNHALNQSLEAQIHISEAYKIYTQQGKTKDALEVRKFAENHNYNVED
jgi:tetratricopeptide (TPR) repeat protein